MRTAFTAYHQQRHLPMRLESRVITATDLDAAMRQSMFELMVRHYGNVSQLDFEVDLAEKQWVILVLSATDESLCGFSTQMILECSVGGRPAKVLFSGDTVVDKDHWGHPALLTAAGQLAHSLMTRWPNEDLFWFLISQGYRTYRFLPLFFREFYPRYAAETPPAIRAMIDSLARQKYPDRYDSQIGVIRSCSTQYRLRPGVADVTDERMRDPHVRYFVQANPGHVRGDELCCLARLSLDNLTTAAMRLLQDADQSG